MIIRAARPGEEAVCAALYERAGRETFTWWPTEAITAAAFLDGAAGEVMHVAEADGGLLGFTSIWAPESFLHSLYIEREERSRGVGAALLAHARDFVEGVLSLKVQKLDTRAIAFYRRHGMTIVEAGGADDPGGGWYRMRVVVD